MITPEPPPGEFSAITEHTEGCTLAITAVRAA